MVNGPAPPPPRGEQISLTSTWFVRPEYQERIRVALQDLAAAVEAGEPGTLMYLVHQPADTSLQSLPPAIAGTVTFFEVYRDAGAFEDHVNGPIFTSFVHTYGPLFVSDSSGHPFTTVTFLSRTAGFSRLVEQVHHASQPPLTNEHPSVMFEVMARDQPAAMQFYRTVFSWAFAEGSQGFQYVPFASTTPPLLGGIGKADAHTPGLQPGCAFYLMVDALQPTIDAAVSAGGSVLLAPTRVDGYHFAMIRDPERNPIGLVEPFTNMPPNLLEPTE